MTPSRLLVALGTALALAWPALTVPALAEPIPQDPGASSVDPFLGAPRGPRPITGVRFAPRHPYLAANGRSNLHDDAYMTDSYKQSGPLGRGTTRTSTLLGRECASIAVCTK